MELKLEAKTNQEKKVLAYLQENVSQTLADKINNGTPFEKDGKPLLNKKTLSEFVKYACEEARKNAENGAIGAFVEDETVYGWAIHYFEEDSIEGTLYTLDGAEYKPVKKVATAVPKSPVIKKPEPPKEKQVSFFDFTSDPSADKEEIDEVSDDEDEIDEDMTEDEGQEIKETPKGTSLYQHYIELQNKYSDFILAYRLGDFYEVLGEKAVTAANTLELTLTGRDCGLEKRVPMCGFPYHVADRYIRKLIDNGFKVALAESLSDVKELSNNQHIDEETGEILSEEEMRKFDGDIEEPADILEEETEIASHFDADVLGRLTQILGDTFIVR